MLGEVHAQWIGEIVTFLCISPAHRAPINSQYSNTRYRSKADLSMTIIFQYPNFFNESFFLEV